MNRNRSKRNWTKALAALIVGSMMFNPNSCVPKDFFFDVAAATQQSLALNITSLVTDAVTSTVLGGIPIDDNSNTNDNSADGG